MRGFKERIIDGQAIRETLEEISLWKGLVFEIGHRFSLLEWDEFVARGGSSANLFASLVDFTDSKAESTWPCPARVDQFG